MAWWVYILRCGDGTLYTGITDDLPRRLAAHRAGKGAKYTRGRGPLSVAYLEEWPDRSAALKREWEIKRQMLELDALTAAMTGSGPTVFGIFADEAAAREAARVLEREYRQVYVTAPWNEKLVQED